MTGNIGNSISSSEGSLMIKTTVQWPPNSGDILRQVIRSFEDGDWWVYKDKAVQTFERRFAEFHDCMHGISVCTGETAVDVALAALEVGPNDQVIMPAFNFYSHVRSVVATGAQPVFVDVRKDNLTIDAEQVANVIARGRIKALIASHISGSVAEMDVLRRICDESGVSLLETCAQATGAVYDSRHCGSWGDIATFSFGGVKLMTCGQGGLVTTSNDRLHERCYALANRGMSSTGNVNTHEIIGQNLQLSELSATILIPQLEALEALAAKREVRMRWLDAQLSAIEGIRIFKQFAKTSRRAQMTYAFFYEAENGEGVDFVARAQQRGIPLHGTYSSVTADRRLLGRFRHFGQFPVAEQAQHMAVAISHRYFLEGDDFWEDLLHRLISVL